MGMDIIVKKEASIVYPLIEIKTIPIEIQMKVTPSRMEYARGTAQVEISRDQGGLSIRSQPIQVNIDTFESRNSVSPTTPTLIRQQAQRGIQAAYQATAVMAQEGRMIMEAQIDQDMIPQLAKQHNIGQPTNVGIKFIPQAPPEISWDGGNISIQYEMDKLNFDWRMEQMQVTFVPGDIEFTVTQRPDVIVTYVGEPLYVPPSSAPAAPTVDINA